MNEKELREPFVSIEGVLHDVYANVMTVEEAKKEIFGYFRKERERVVREIEKLEIDEQFAGHWKNGFYHCKVDVLKIINQDK